MEKQYLILFSATGRTKRVADILTTALGGTWTTIDLGTPDAALPSVSIDRDDLCLAAVPVFEGRVPTPAVHRLMQLQGNGASAILAAVYGNRAVDDCLLELRDIMSGQGFACRGAIAAVAEHSIFPKFGHARPDTEDETQLKAFAADIKVGLEVGTLPALVKVPGNDPYKDMGGISVHPAADDSCVQCGICASRCPVGAIPKDQPGTTDGTKCVTCMRCATVCPQGARHFPAAIYSQVEQAMAPVLSGRKENVLYLEEAPK